LIINNHANHLNHKNHSSDNLMNINQNFKNYLWAVQHGTNLRVRLENEVASLYFSRQYVINNILVSSTEDTLGVIADTLIDYLANSTYLNDRKIRFSLLLEKERYTEASNELNVIIGLTYDLPLNLQEQYNDFAVLAQILITTLQMPDSLSDSLILANVPFIQSIAIQEHHIAKAMQNLYWNRQDMYRNIKYLYPMELR